MPYRPEAELKRPDLKGEFLCGHCGKTFCHAASLNRHRLNFHGDDQQCLVCHTQIPQNDTVRRHMQQVHDIPRVFTCGCCNWTFPDKKELHSHNNSMLKTGTPGEAKAIAISSRAPGSLSQHELRGEERSPRAAKKSAKSGSTQSTPNDPLLSLLGGIGGIPASWIANLLAAQPALLPFLPTSSASSTTSSSETETPEPTTATSLDTVLSAMMSNDNNNEEGAEEEEVDIGGDREDGKDLLMKVVGADFLSVKTEQAASESGIGSAPFSNTPSPTSGSELLHDAVQKAKKANKRRSIDDICYNLVVKKSCL